MLRRDVAADVADGILTRSPLARQHAQMRSALAEIEAEAMAAIERYGVLAEPQGPPETWITRIDAVLGAVGPLRDTARRGLRDIEPKENP